MWQQQQPNPATFTVPAMQPALPQTCKPSSTSGTTSCPSYSLQVMAMVSSTNLQALQGFQKSLALHGQHSAHSGASVLQRRCTRPTRLSLLPEACSLLKPALQLLALDGLLLALLHSLQAWLKLTQLQQHFVGGMCTRGLAKSLLATMGLLRPVVISLYQHRHSRCQTSCCGQVCRLFA